MTNWLANLRRWLYGSSVWPAATAAAVTLALALSLYIVQMQSNLRTLTAQLEDAQGELAELHTTATQLQIANAELRRQLQDNVDQLTLFADADRVVTLEGTEAAPEASGTFYAGGTFNILTLRGLEPLSEEQVYELWLIPQEGDPIPAGLAKVDATGSATVILPPTEQPASLAAVGVSIEPAAGSTYPTGPIVLLGTVSSG